MKLQEIILSPDVLQRVKTSLSHDPTKMPDLKSYSENLIDKSFLFDSDEDGESQIENEIRKLIAGSYDFSKIVEWLFKPVWSNNRKVQFKTFVMKKYVADSVRNMIINLAVNSDTKIVNCEDKSPALLCVKHPEISNVEFLNMEEIVDPPARSKLRSMKRAIEIPQGERFEFEDCFKTFLEDSNNILINDRYIRTHIGLTNTVKILRLCPELRNVIIHTILRDGNPKDNFDYTVKQFEDELQKVFSGVSFKLKPILREFGKLRVLINEEYKFSLLPGIDFVNRDFVADKNPINIRIEKIRK
jgi:hypothetical protein